MDPMDFVGRTLETGREVTQRSQERLESLIGQLQRLSEEQLDQVAAIVGEVRDRSLLSGEQLAAVIDRQVRAQLSAVGIATRADLERVEAKLDRLADSPGPKRASARSASKEGGGTKGKAKGKGKGKGKAKSSGKASPGMAGSAASGTAGG